MNFQRIIESTRANVRTVQTIYSNQHFDADRIRPPFPFYLWLDRRFRKQFKDQRMLLERGYVVWASIIQANRSLFDPNGPRTSLPAAIIYCADRSFDAQPAYLHDYARNLFAAKGKATSPEMQRFADKLADEFVADNRLAIPKTATGGAQCFYSTIMLSRDHFPLRCLSFPLFPILIAPQESEVGTPLPHVYWDQELRDAWISNSSD